MSRDLRKHFKFGTNVVTAVSDADGNRCNVSFWKSYSRAEAALLSLTKCKNCIDCKDCDHCEDCTGCRDCAGCVGCRECLDCAGCSHCEKCCQCAHCLSCEKCFLCKNCMEGTGGVEVEDQNGFNKFDLSCSGPCQNGIGVWDTSQTDVPHPRKGKVKKTLFYLTEEARGILPGPFYCLVDRNVIKESLKVAAKKGETCVWNEEERHWETEGRRIGLSEEHVEEI